MVYVAKNKPSEGKTHDISVPAVPTDGGPPAKPSVYNTVKDLEMADVPVLGTNVTKYYAYHPPPPGGPAMH
jgi:hypothetical protein